MLHYYYYYYYYYYYMVALIEHPPTHLRRNEANATLAVPVGGIERFRLA